MPLVPLLAVGPNVTLILVILAIGVVVWLVDRTTIRAFFKWSIYFICAVIVIVLLFKFVEREIPGLLNW